MNLQRVLLCIFSLLILDAELPRVLAAHPALPAARYVGQFLLEYAAGKVLDRAIDTTADTQLGAFQESLSRIDTKLAAEISALRSDVNRRPTYGDVRMVVEKALKSLEARVDRVDERIVEAHSRIDEIRLELGYFPALPPVPLVFSDVNGQPEAHPLTARWIKLLVDSESNRRLMNELAKSYTVKHPEFVAAIQADDRIAREVEQLHTEVKLEVASKLSERESLLETHLPTSEKVRQIDKSLAPITWLVSVTKPRPEGTNKARLAVPSTILADQSSDIVKAFQLSGVELHAVAPLYRQVLAAPFIDPQPVISMVALPAPMYAVSQKQYLLLLRQNDLAASISRTKRKISELESSGRTSSDDEYVSAERERRTQIDQIRRLGEHSDELIDECVMEYLAAMQNLRATSDEMLYFRYWIMARLFELHDASSLAPDCAYTVECEKWNSFKPVKRRCQIRLQHEATEITAWEVSDDGGRIAAAGTNGNVIIWETLGYTVLAQSTPRAWTVEQIVFNASNNEEIAYIAFYKESRHCVFHSLKDGSLRAVSLPTEVHARSVSFSPDGRFLAVGTSNSTIDLYDVSTLKFHASLAPPEYSGRLSYDELSQRNITARQKELTEPIVLASDAFKVAEFDKNSLAPDRTNFAVAFSPDSRLVAAGTLFAANKMIAKDDKKVRYEVPATPDYTVDVWSIDGFKHTRRFYVSYVVPNGSLKFHATRALLTSGEKVDTSRILGQPDFYKVVDNWAIGGGENDRYASSLLHPQRSYKPNFDTQMPKYRVVPDPFLGRIGIPVDVPRVISMRQTYDADAISNLCKRRNEVSQLFLWYNSDKTPSRSSSDFSINVSSNVLCMVPVE